MTESPLNVTENKGYDYLLVEIYTAAASSVTSPPSTPAPPSSSNPASSSSSSPSAGGLTVISQIEDKVISLFTSKIQTFTSSSSSSSSGKKTETETVKTALELSKYASTEIALLIQTLGPAFTCAASDGYHLNVKQPAEVVTEVNEGNGEEMIVGDDGVVSFPSNGDNNNGDEDGDDDGMNDEDENADMNDGEKTKKINEHDFACAVRSAALLALRGAIKASFPSSPFSITSTSTSMLSLVLTPPLQLLKILGNFLKSRVLDPPSSEMVFSVTKALVNACGHSIKSSSFSSSSSSSSTSSCELSLEQKRNLHIHRFTIASNVINASGINTLTRVVRSVAFDMILCVANVLDYDCMFESHSSSTSSASSEDKTKTTTTTAQDVSKSASNFARSACDAMYGEKDPRCLLACLRCLRAVQDNVAPFCIDDSTNSNNNSNSNNNDYDNDYDEGDMTFPRQQIFDAVGVYYPVTFSPPPNDAHGISNRILRDALNDVLAGEKPCHVITISKDKDDRNSKEKKSKKQYGYGYVTNITDAVQMLLNRLGDSEVGDNQDSDSDTTTTSLDRRDAIEDLIYITSRCSGAVHAYSECLVEARQALINAHEAFTSSGDVEDKMYDVSCLKLVTSIAAEVEKTSSEEMYDAFNGGGIRGVCDAVVDAPESMNGRSGVRYLCAVAKGGGRGLRDVMNATAEALLEICEASARDKDERRTEAAATALGMIFSSSKSSVVHVPCPILPYVDRAMEALKGLAVKERNVGAVLAVNALLCEAPGGAVGVEVVRGLCEDLVKVVTGVVTGAGAGGGAGMKSAGESESAESEMRVDNDNDGDGDNDNDEQGWLAACAYTLGTILSSGRYDPCILDCVTRLVKAAVSPSASFSANANTNTNANTNGNGNGNGNGVKQQRYEIKALATACTCSSVICDMVIPELTAVLCERLLNTSSSSASASVSAAVNAAVALLTVMQTPTVHASNAFDKAKAATLILTAFTANNSSSSSQEQEQRTKKHEHVIIYITQIFSHGRFVGPSSRSRRDVVSFISPLLLSDGSGERGKALIVLPVFAAAVRDYTRVDVDIDVEVDVDADIDDDDDDCNVSMSDGDSKKSKSDNVSNVNNVNITNLLPKLCDVCLDMTVKGMCRSAAGLGILSIIHGAGAGAGAGAGGEDLARKVLNDSITPVLAKYQTNSSKSNFASNNNTTTTNNNSGSLAAFSNLLKMLASVGGAAACRGGTSASSADLVVAFLTGLCVDGYSSWHSTDSHNGQSVIYIIGGSVSGSDSDSDNGNDGASAGSVAVSIKEAQTQAGHAFGVFLSLSGGGQFWRQRAASISLPRILQAIEDKGKTKSTSGTNEGILGCLCAVGHFACTLPLSVVGNTWSGDGSTTMNLVGGLMVGLVVSERVLTEEMDNLQTPTASVILNVWTLLSRTALSAFVRLTASGHASIVDYLPSLFPTLLHYASKPCTTTSSSSSSSSSNNDNNNNVACNLLALQCLLNIINGGQGNSFLKFTKIKPFIQMVQFKLSHGVLRHGMRRVRMAGVVVGNAYTVYSTNGGGGNE